MASAAATTTSATTAAAAQNPNPLNLNIKLPPWLSGLRCPLTFVCPPPTPPPPPPPTPLPLPPPEPVVSRSRSLPSLRVTTEYDSEEGVFVNKVSCKLAGDLAKLRLSFQSDPQGQWQGGGEELEEHPLQQLFTAPLVGLITKRFSVLYDVEARNALLRGGCSLPGGAVQLRASHDVKAQQGEVSVITSLGDSLYKMELSSLVPYSGLPRATFHFPIGQVSVEEKRNEDDDKVLSVYGIGKSDFLDGVLTAQYNENDLNLRYCYKDKELTLVPSVSLPSHAASIDFKRRFGPSDKLSYGYNFSTDDWNAVYKHKVGKNFKVKAGYDSEVRVGWASLWVGEEGGKAKTAPMKTKLQLMLQVPQDNPRNPYFLFNVKKRWDL